VTQGLRIAVNVPLPRRPIRPKPKETDVQIRLKQISISSSLLCILPSDFPTSAQTVVSKSSAPCAWARFRVSGFFHGGEKRQFLVLRFCRSRRKGSVLKHLGGALHPGGAGVRYWLAGKSKRKSRFTLSRIGETGVLWGRVEIKMGMPVNTARMPTGWAGALDGYIAGEN
jgi:hypothetical protein